MPISMHMHLKRVNATEIWFNVSPYFDPQLIMIAICNKISYKIAEGGPINRGLYVQRPNHTTWWLADESFLEF